MGIRKRRLILDFRQSIQYRNATRRRSDYEEVFLSKINIVNVL